MKDQLLCAGIAALASAPLLVNASTRTQFVQTWIIVFWVLYTSLHPGSQ